MKEPPVSEEELRLWFNRVADGDEAAFTLLYIHFTPIILPFAEQKLKSGTDAQEVVQEVFLKLWMYRSALKGIENPTPYVYRTVSNMISNRFSRLKREYTLIKELAVESQQSLEPDANYADLRSRYAVAVSGLPKDRRKIFLMRQEGLMPTEIARALGLSINTVKTQLKRAFTTVRESLIAGGLPAILVASLLERF
ncbi:MAG: sigma-70 family RNA polymerase sigma factor [Bacteroidota bacterium]